ncbi:hypothetical protein GCM10011507_08450 [Edaphobacter acidisoli]|uniref:Uncharacterized protein n=1 Tax=Edaphobacter acidisoli TaxID=2040573 RepID=A0A916RKG6_9BACT|nr:hypothetical protein GCM10011507_08450 [Edaphobacter acidisoli]
MKIFSEPLMIASDGRCHARHLGNNLAQSVITCHNIASFLCYERGGGPLRYLSSE